jgi:hypothetical protein
MRSQQEEEVQQEEPAHIIVTWMGKACHHAGRVEGAVLLVNKK